MVGWSTSFAAASLVEEEGKKLIDNNKKRKLIINDKNNDDDDDDDDEDDEEGGFSQPNKLAKFLRQLDNTSIAIDNIIQVGNNIDDTTTKQIDNMNRQICRIWLKHTYLGSDVACNDGTCMRKHSIDLNPDSLGRLYKDYSFKGLNQGQRQRIINKIKDDNNINISNIKKDKKDDSKNISPHIKKKRKH